MKQTILTLLALATAMGTAKSATVNPGNYDIDALTSKPISLLDGTALASGGVVAIGWFSSDITALLPGIATDGGKAAVIAAFNVFGTTIEGNSTQKIGEAGAGFEGLYDKPVSGAINAGDAIIGQNIYTLIGNGDTLATSSQLAIIRDANTFGADAPLFTAGAGLLEADASVVYGLATGPSVKPNAAFEGAASVQLQPFGVIPEPMSAAFLLSSLAFVVRRRRA